MIEPLYSIGECYEEINYWNLKYKYNEVLKEYQMIYLEAKAHRLSEEKQLYQYLKAANGIYPNF